jgi:glycosyltransferase involved in cell wall biosynthesis
VHVFTTNVDGPRDSDVPLDEVVVIDGVKVRYFPSRRLRRLYWSPSMARALRSEVGTFDIVHLHSVFLWPTWAAARAARRRDVPYVLSPRGMLVTDLIRRKSRCLKRAWIRLIERKNIARAAAIHLTSAAEARELAQLKLPVASTIVIANGISLPDPAGTPAVSRDLESLLSQPVLVLFLGRINWKKGLDRLVPAMIAVPDAHLAIVGNDEEGLLPKLVALVDRHGLGGRVTFVPRVVERADRDRLMAAAKVFVLPSYSENFGNTVLEAMAVGCPVLVTPDVGAAEIVLESGAGRVAPGDPASFGQALRDLVDDPDRAEAGARGRRHVLEHFAWPAIAERMERAYLDVRASRSRGSASGA